jgi:hypothetical protein
MAEQIYPGRYTAEMDDSFVVFLIGARFNDWKIWKYRWVGQAMNNMVATLSEHPEKGFLGGETFIRFNPITTVLVSYWRSYEDLEKFAHDKNDPHLEPWRRFMREIGSDGSFGIWHETYKVEAGAYETMYGNMPVFGLGKATKHVAIQQRSDSARQRINRVHAQSNTDSIQSHPVERAYHE